MKARMMNTLTVGLMMLIVLCAAAAAQNVPSSDLLLPYFEVDSANTGGLTTLFAVGNATEKPVDVLATVYTNWAIPILEVPFTLQPHEVRTVNLRDWFRTGGNPAKTLTTAELQHLKAAASGQRSPKDNLFYSSEIRPDLLVGYVVVHTQGNRPDALWGDWFNVDVGGNLARGDVLPNIDRSTGCPGLCERHLVRYLSGGGFDGGTEIIIWRDTTGKPSANAGAGPKMQADATAFDEPGAPIENRQLALLPVEKVVVNELGLRKPFGSLDIESADATFIAVQHTAENRYSVGLTTYCLPRKTNPGPGIEILKVTNGQDADAAPGPSIPVGAAVTWDYLVTNTGNVELTDIVVEDDDPSLKVVCPKDTLAPGESMTCTASGKAKACQYKNIGGVSALSAKGAVNDSDVSHYFGDEGAELALAVLLNGKDAGDARNPVALDVDTTLDWTFKVTNTGKIRLTGVQLTGVSALCDKTALNPGETAVCTANGGKALEGDHSVQAHAAGKTSCADISANGAGYYKAAPGNHTGEPGIRIVKLTNGQDANTAPGPQIPAGSPVTWTYQVTNTGDVALSNVSVTDDKGVAVSCPKTTLQPGEVMTCTGHGTAQACQYENLGTASGRAPNGQTVTGSDPSHYYGTTNPAIDVETKVNGDDADAPTGPQIAAGSPVSFTYIVRNTGDVALTGVHVTDSHGVTVSCPKTTLAAGESMTCTANGTAQSGQYSSVGSATGNGACGSQVSDSDPVYYYGAITGGDEGCSHGYWKNHPGSWAATGYSTGQRVDSVFSQASLYPSIASVSLMDSLSFSGGPTVTDAARNMLKQATGSLLNSAHPGVDFPWTTAQLISEVNAALASQNASVLLDLANQLDHDNTLGCPLN